MVQYDLSHLVQPDAQAVVGPIQDDEALFLFALIRVMRLRRVLELGGLSGYSARNFIAAVGTAGTVYSVDLNPIPAVAPNHVTIQRDANEVLASDVGDIPLDLIFFDCHVYDAQINLFSRLRSAGMVTDRTVIAFHDTNLHPRKFADWPYEIEPGQWVHQDVERKMVNRFRELGYDIFHLDTVMSDHGPHLPFRHGLTLARQFKPLMT